MTHPDAAFDALVQHADREIDTILSTSLDVEGMLSQVKRQAVNAHVTAVQAVGQEQKELRLVGATLSRAFTAPVQPARQSPVQSAATLRPADGLREVHSEENGFAEASTDLAIILGDAVDGDRAAVELLLSYVRPLVVRYCRARVGRQERSFASADDVAQEVCLAVLTALSSYRDQGRPFLAFVYGIAAQKVANAHRAAARNRTEAVADLPDGPTMITEREQAVARVEMTSRMADLLQVLPAKQREILVLRVVVGLTAEETADAIGSTPGAVRVAQHQALARLRTIAGRLDIY
jgi:RNA polymerase sigma-70 factor (ECF subfamily)